MAGGPCGTIPSAEAYSAFSQKELCGSVCHLHARPRAAAPIRSPSNQKSWGRSEGPHRLRTPRLIFEAVNDAKPEPCNANY